MYQTIKKFLNNGGKCLLIEDGKPVGVVLTVEEYDRLQGECQNSNIKSQTNPGTPTQSPPYQGGEKEGVVAPNSIGEAMTKEMDYPEASAEISDIEATDDVTLEDLGVDELPY